MLEPDPELAVAYGIFSVRQARAAGYSRADIERHVRRGGWTRRGNGVLAVVARTPLATDELVLASLLAGPGAVVAFLSAARVHGWGLRTEPRRPQLILPLSRVCGGYRTALTDDDIACVGNLRVTTPQRTALDIAAAADFDEAVIALDSALRSGVSLADLVRLFDSSHRRGVRAAREALAAADPRSGSVPETEARLLFARAGMPAPTSQCVVRANQRFVARLDFGWEDAMLGAEIDGFAYHSSSGDFQRDRTRQNEVQLGGWLVLRFTVADIRERPELVVAEVRRGLQRQRHPG